VGLTVSYQSGILRSDGGSAPAAARPARKPRKEPYCDCGFRGRGHEHARRPSRRRFFRIEDFHARLVGRHLVNLYPFKRDRFRRVEIYLPHREIRLTGKMGFEAGYVSVPSHGLLGSVRKGVRLGRAIVAASIYLSEARVIARGEG
jgi:hypothetical protein